MVSFQTKNPSFGYILEDLGVENVVNFSGHLEHFTTIGYILWAFGNFVVIWCIFPPIWYILPKNLATLCRSRDGWKRTKGETYF
jgi:hypothetical protein